MEIYGLFGFMFGMFALFVALQASQETAKLRREVRALRGDPPAEERPQSRWVLVVLGVITIVLLTLIFSVGTIMNPKAG